MKLCAEAAAAEDVLSWRDLYLLEMGCQIVHDSIHTRPGWTREYVLCCGNDRVGYGSVAVAGPWTDRPKVYEFYIVPQHRVHIFDLFGVLLDASGAVMIEVQSNDSLATIMLHTFTKDVTRQSILFHDKLTTSRVAPGATFRQPAAAEAVDIPKEQLRWHGVVEVEGRIAATGGILFHYNPPYGDIYMEVEESFRRRGLGSFLVQELKRVCYAGGRIPGARCNPGNVASRRTLQRAGFVPCGHILSGRVSH